MKSFVLMCKRTGYLFVGFRVNLVDREDDSVSSEIGGQTYVVNLRCVNDCDGWIMEGPPEVSPQGMKWFFNREGAEGFFENLGEL
jgi:hypothetical protein